MLRTDLVVIHRFGVLDVRPLILETSEELGFGVVCAY